VQRPRVHKAGVFFDCVECGKLLRECIEHNPPDPPTCPECSGALRTVGIGNAMVQYAVWLRCGACKKLWMRRRGAVVETKPRAGFDRYT
jgi:hypothetical protein